MPQVTTAEVSYVNQPNKNPNYGSIKTKDGTYYSVRKSELGMFEKGKVYTFEFSTNEKGYHSFTRMTGGDDHPANKPNGNGGGSYKDASPETAERIFVCGVVNGWAQAGKIGVSSSELVDAVSVAREAWAGTLGAPE